MTAIPRLRVEDEEEYFSNPFRTCDKKTFAGNKKVLKRWFMLLDEIVTVEVTSKLVLSVKLPTGPESF